MALDKICSASIFSWFFFTSFFWWRPIWSISTAFFEVESRIQIFAWIRLQKLAWVCLIFVCQNPMLLEFTQCKRCRRRRHCWWIRRFILFLKTGWEVAGTFCSSALFWLKEVLLYSHGTTKKAKICSFLTINCRHNFLNIFQTLLSSAKNSLWKQNETENYKPIFKVIKSSNIKAILHVT